MSAEINMSTDGKSNSIKRRKKGRKNSNNKEAINEIEELKKAMDLLFGEQQVQNNQERVKFKA